MASFAVCLTGCVMPVEPLVSDFNGSSVKLQVPGFATDPDVGAKVKAEADRICGRVKKRAEYASTRVLPDYVNEHLYLCL